MKLLLGKKEIRLNFDAVKLVYWSFCKKFTSYIYANITKQSNMACNGCINKCGILHFYNLPFK